MDAPHRLEAWKEIASYLGRDVRTAIRWEKDRRLPIHRVPGGKRGAVYAYRHEIDQWLARAERVGTDDRESANDGVATTKGAAAGRPRLTHLEEQVRADGPGSKRQLLWVAVVAALAVVTWAWARFWRGPPIGREDPGAVSDAIPVVDQLEFRRSEIVARDAAGRGLWRHASEVPISVKGAAPQPSPRYTIADLDRDGTAELIVSLGRWVTPTTTQDELLCFSETGRVRWRLRLDDVVAFRGGTFGPPWSDGLVTVYRVGGEARIAWSQNSPPSWPSVLSVLDTGGRRLSRFVHSGSIYALATIEAVEGPVILGGVVSNSSRAAGLFALDGRAAQGHSNEPAGSAYECLNCPSGMPLGYYLFPPSELNSALGRPYNVPLRVDAVPGGFAVMTQELGTGGSDLDPVAQQRFVFSSEFELRQASHSDSWPAHEQLERMGRLDHAVADCPMYRVPPPARAWDAARGWRELTPAGVAAVTVGPRPRGR